MTRAADADHELYVAFEAGAYAAAYEDVGGGYAEASQGARSWPEAYRAAFILGFFAVYERHEVPDAHLAEYERALASEHGARCVELGFVDRCFLNAHAVGG